MLNSVDTTAVLLHGPTGAQAPGPEDLKGSGGSGIHREKIIILNFVWYIFLK